MTDRSPKEISKMELNFNPMSASFSITDIVDKINEIVERVNELSIEKVMKDDESDN